jgi:uncharacterized DUF497 family protein
MDLERIVGFDWDAGNRRKNEAHGVGQSEAEQVFFNFPLIVPDPAHSQSEPRYHALGRTDTGRLLHITFTLRRELTLIRMISARPASRKERAIHESSENPQIQD